MRASVGEFRSLSGLGARCWELAVIGLAHDSRPPSSQYLDQPERDRSLPERLRHVSHSRFQTSGFRLCPSQLSLCFEPIFEVAPAGAAALEVALVGAGADLLLARLIAVVLHPLD